MLQSQILLPSLLLQPYVHHYWILHANNVLLSQRILPLGCMKWMFHRKKPLVVNGVVDGGQVTVCGQYDSAIDVMNVDDVDMIVVFFQPFAMKFIMNMPCDLFKGNNVDFECIEWKELTELKHQVLTAESDSECITLIEKFLLKKLQNEKESPYLPALATVFQQIAKTPDVRIEALAETACLSERQFRRVFSEHVGMSPKQALRIRRFLYAANSLRKYGDANFENVILDLGFTDHSHFNKEFHEFAKMSPSEFLQYMESVKQTGTIKAYRSYHGY